MISLNCDNSNFLFKKLTSNETTNNTCPDGVTKDMLLKELMCGDLEAMGNEIMDDIDSLWGLFYYMNTNSTSPFGFTFLGNEVSIPIVTEQPITNRKSSVRKKQTTNVNDKTRRSSTKGPKQPNKQTKKRRVLNRLYNSVFGQSTKQRVRIYGGENRYIGNKNLYISLLNKTEDVPGIYQGDLSPRWGACRDGTSFNTLTMLKPVNGIQLYVYGSSLPIKNVFSSPMSLGVKQYCANTLFFYKFIKNISRIISLQGCGLDWNSIKLPPKKILPYLPSDCKGLEERHIWDTLCKSNDDDYDRNNSSLLEYYWLDMSGGFFETFKDIASLDFTNPETTTLIHCLAGFGRTGTTLLLILSRYYFSQIDQTSRFNEMFNKPIDGGILIKRIHSSSICKFLKKLLTGHLKLDLLNDNSVSDLTQQNVTNIRGLISKFDVSSVTTEVFNFIHDNAISLTLLNVFITRINYIIYFTAHMNGFSQVNLYKLYSNDELNYVIRSITRDNMLEFPLRFPIKVDVQNTINIPAVSGLQRIIPRHSYTPTPPPPPADVVNLDEDKGDDRPSENIRPSVDIPTQEERTFTSPLAKRQQSKRQQSNQSGFVHVEI
jgi:hypothetical protein